MTTNAIMLVLSAFLACTVEAVEALTVTLAVGVTRGWRSALLGAALAALVLGGLVVVFGSALSRMPLDALRIVVGALLLTFGLGWLRKAILRASGYKALRDEAAIYRTQVEQARRRTDATARVTEWHGFVLAFKAVFLEGLEVVFIVLAFGASPHGVRLASFGAGLAVVLVGAVGAWVHEPLSRVPENTMKSAVGLMLSAFGIFWSGEGAGVRWPGAELSVLGIFGFLGFAALGAIVRLRRERGGGLRLPPAAARTDVERRYPRRFVLFWYDFIVGDDWVVPAGVAILLVATHWLVRVHVNAWWIMLVAVVPLLAVSLRRETRKSRTP